MSIEQLLLLVQMYIDFVHATHIATTNLTGSMNPVVGSLS